MSGYGVGFEQGFKIDADSLRLHFRQKDFAQTRRGKKDAGQGTNQGVNQGVNQGANQGLYVIDR